MENKQYIEVARAFASMSYQGVYLVDEATDKFVYNSASTLFQTDIQEWSLKGLDAHTLFSDVSDKEKYIMSVMVGTIRRGYADIPHELLNNFSFSFNIHIKRNGLFVAVNHKISFLDIDENGKPRILLGLVSPSVHDIESVVFGSISVADHFFIFNKKSLEWEQMNATHLSDHELAMLRYSMLGYSLESISGLMYKSIDTIRFYRRRIFEKFNVKNISEAISLAIHYGII